ncbi:hypothetical protein VDGL01_09812 [Verticillium dahliae]
MWSLWFSSFPSAPRLRFWPSFQSRRSFHPVSGHDNDMEAISTGPILQALDYPQHAPGLAGAEEERQQEERSVIASSHLPNRTRPSTAAEHASYPFVCAISSRADAQWLSPSALGKAQPHLAAAEAITAISRRPQRHSA